MGGFTEEMRARLPAPMALPEPLAALFDWIEARGLLHQSQRFPDDRYGSLQPLNEDNLAGTVILFRVEKPAQAAESARWFGGKCEDPDMARRLVPFARVGGDGSHAAFWLDEEAIQHIVLLGSEGDACELGSTPLDFLRLCAIGYSDFVGDMLDRPDEPPKVEGQIVVNTPFLEWLTATYGVTVPATASEILGQPPNSKTLSHPDPFWRWTQAHITSARTAEKQGH